MQVNPVVPAVIAPQSQQNPVASVIQFPIAQLPSTAFQQVIKEGEGYQSSQVYSPPHFPSSQEESKRGVTSVFSLQFCIVFTL